MCTAPGRECEVPSVARLSVSQKDLDDDVSSVDANQRLTEPLVTEQSSVEERIALFRNLFRGRENVYPIWWTNTANWSEGVRTSGQRWLGSSVQRGSLVPTHYLPLTDDVFREHLSGQQSIGIYHSSVTRPAGSSRAILMANRILHTPTGAQHLGIATPPAIHKRTRLRGHLMRAHQPRASTTAFRPISSARAQARAGMCGSFSRARFPPPRHVT